MTQAYKVGLLLIDGLDIMSYASVTEPLRAANSIAGQTLYQLFNIPVFGARAQASNHVEIRASSQVGERSDFDLLLVLAAGNPAEFNDKRIFQWLRHLARLGVTLGGVSGGALILAAAEVMNGYRMTTHWAYVDLLNELHPQLMVEDLLYVVDRNRITCAGGTAPLDMMHALISLHHGADFALQVSDWFLHTDVRHVDQPQRSSMAQRYRCWNPVILQTIETMQSHLNDPLDLEQLAQINQVSSRQLNRLFQENLGISTMAFYRDLRLDKAWQFIEKSPLTLTEIALSTGFSSSANFSKAFRQRFGAAPSSLRQRVV